MNPLQDLKDIHTPASIENWPPAYGWWLLVVLVLVAVYLLTIWLINVRKVRLAKRQALQALQQIDGSSLDCVSQLNQLLKRVAIMYFPHQDLQKMHGAKWTAFLVQTLPIKKAKDFSRPLESMQQALYQKHTTQNAEFSSYSSSVATWIKHALPPSQSMVKQLEQKNA